MPLSLIDLDDSMTHFEWASDRIRKLFAAGIEFAYADGLDVDAFDAGLNWKIYRYRAEQAAKAGDVYRTLLRCEAWEEKVRSDLRFWITAERRRIGRASASEAKAA